MLTARSSHPRRPEKCDSTNHVGKYTAVETRRIVRDLGRIHIIRTERVGKVQERTAVLARQRSSSL